MDILSELPIKWTRGLQIPRCRQNACLRHGTYAHLKQHFQHLIAKRILDWSLEPLVSPRPELIKEGATGFHGSSDERIDGREKKDP